MARAIGVKPEVDVLPSADALATAGAKRFVDAATESIGARGEFVVALSGGTTPAALYARLATPAYATQLDWSCIHVLWSDERCVPPDDPASNYRMASETLLDHVPVPPLHVHRIKGEVDPTQAADAYEQELRALLRTPTGAPRTAPGARIDLALLGLGEDGHTASLFPGSPRNMDADRWVAPVLTSPVHRVTLTSRLLNAASEIVFLVSGQSKAAILRRVFDEPSADLPAQRIAPIAGRLLWLVDADAYGQR